MRTAAAGLAVAALAALPTAATATAPAPQVAHLLHAEPTRIADDQGRTVILRGVNVNGFGEYYQEWPDLPATVPLTEDDFAEMASMGFDVVRLIISWSRIEPAPGRIDHAYLDRVAQGIGWARAHDLYVVLDMHQDAWGVAVGTPDGVTCPEHLVPAVGWDGAPAWATALVGTVATCRASLGREFSPAVQASFQAFYADAGNLQGHLAGAWSAVAQRLGRNTAVAGYDLLNEPNPGFAIGADDYALLGLAYRRMLTGIRAGEANGRAPGHIGFFEPSVITGPLATPGPLPGFTADRNVVYAPHLYNESISPLPGMTIEAGFANAATAARSFGTTFWVGEWGWFGDAVHDQPYLERYAAAEDAHRVGGTWWQWKQACGDPHAVGARRVRPGCAGTSPYSDGVVTRPRANTMVLDRSYIRAAPGTLSAMRSTIATGALAAQGMSGRPGTSADLWVPERCASPVVTGTNIGAAVRTEVPGGWRITVPVPNSGAYRIAVAC